jgi:inhibitor of nuclear factor kappa-B kinase subunit alpha
VGFKPYKLQKAHGLSAAQKEKRRIRCRRLLRRSGNDWVNSIIFSDEKIFTVEEKLNKQNDRIYAASIEDIPEEMRTVPRFQSPSSFMVWAAVSAQGKFPLVFVERGVKVNGNYYQREILQKIVKPAGKRIFKNQQWTFQQDSAPAHSAKINQTWCEVNLPDFINSSEWPPSFAGLEPAGLFGYGTFWKPRSTLPNTNVWTRSNVLFSESGRSFRWEWSVLSSIYGVRDCGLV